MIETFSQGRLTRRLKDTGASGKWDTIYYFSNNELIREERDTNGDGFFDLRIIYDKGQVVRQEADTNADHRVDVWVKFENGQKIEQLEDQSFSGKLTARYVFKGGQLAGQEQLANVDPPDSASPFTAVEEELRKMAAYGGSPVEGEASAAARGLLSGAEIQ
jgi:hypothetical protein